MINVMKNAILKTVFSSLLLLGTSSICHAKPEHRISIGAGVLSYIYINEICDEHADVELAPPYFGGNKIIGYSTYEYAWRDLQSLPITANLHYECTLGKHFGIGLCVGYEHQKMDLDINVYTYTGEKITPYGIYDNYDITKKSGKLDRRFFYAMPEATLYYFKKEHVSMYGKLAAGISFSKIKRENADEETRGTRFKNQHFSGQVSPVCLEIGNKNICGFMEYGFGHQGIAQFGVKHTFKKKNESAK